MQKLLAPLNHKPTSDALSSERSFMRVFEGSCTTPIAAHAEVNGDDISLRCLIAKPDGSVIHRTARNGKISDAESMGADAGLELKKTSGENFFD